MTFPADIFNAVLYRQNFQPAWE